MGVKPSLILRAGCAALVLIIASCARPAKPRPLDPEAFYLPRSGAAERPLGPVDPPPSPRRGVGVDLLAPQDEQRAPDPEPNDLRRAIERPVPAEAGDQGSGDANGSRDAAGPLATEASTRMPGRYLTIGGVVAEVNGRPIFANRVINELRSELAGMAREHDEIEFRRLARVRINEKRDELIRNELHFAAAERHLDPTDKALARRLTTQWRQRQIYEAGGSVELARRRAQAQGADFDELVAEYHRLIIRQLFQERRIAPRVQISAEDMRRYYDEHKARSFTDHDEVRFRLIKIDPNHVGSRSLAMERAAELHVQAQEMSGQEFAALAGSSVNHDEYLRRRDGDVGWIWRDNYALRKLEAAVWELRIGEVTDVIEEQGGFYIARLEDRKMGRVQPFDSEETQAKIRRVLEDRQMEAIWAGIMAGFVPTVVVRDDPELLETAVEMAVQEYPAWSTAATSAAGP